MSAALPQLRLPAVTISDREKTFVVSFGEVVRACSWAIVHGGIVDAEHVAWVEVSNSELGPAVDARAFLAARLRNERLTRAVGLLTSRRITSRVDLSAARGGVTARSIATVGLGNALRAGDAPFSGPAAGTINVLVHVDMPLTDEGLLEASAIATEAKCAALFDARVASKKSGALATGTGTDCTVVTCPRASWGKRAAPYAGKHTEVGAAIGAVVSQVIRIGIDEWQKETGG